MASFVFGLFVLALGIVCVLESNLGLAPWDVLHQGIARHSPLLFGQANIAVGVVVVAAAWSLGARPGLGTIGNAVLVGAFIDAGISVGVVPTVSEGDVFGRVALMLFGILLFGAGSAFYIGVVLGAGPRDSLMLVTATRARVRLRVARAWIELSALASRVLLGGKVGLGTLAFALLIGPSVEFSFWLLRRSPLVLQPAEVEPKLASGR